MATPLMPKATAVWLVENTTLSFEQIAEFCGMPRRVLPVRRPDLPVIDAQRLVPSDVEDFVALLRYLGQRYFLRPNYLRVAGLPYFSIFDSSFFLRELGLSQAALAIRMGREALQALGLPGLHDHAAALAPPARRDATAAGLPRCARRPDLTVSAAFSTKYRRASPCRGTPSSCSPCRRG